MGKVVNYVKKYVYHCALLHGDRYLCGIPLVFTDEENDV